jgi:WD40 repeat protein
MSEGRRRCSIEAKGPFHGLLLAFLASCLSATTVTANDDIQPAISYDISSIPTVAKCVISPDWRFAASASINRLQLLSLTRRANVRRLSISASGGHELSFADSGDRLLVSTHHDVTLWNLRRNQPISYVLNDRKDVRSAWLSPGGDRLLLISTIKDSGDPRRLEVWKSTPPELIASRIIEADEDAIVFGAPTTDAIYVSTGRTIEQYDGKSLETVRSISIGGGFDRWRWSSDGNTLYCFLIGRIVAVAFADGVAPRTVYQFARVKGLVGDPPIIELTPDESRVLACHKTTFTTVRLEAQTDLNREGADRNIRCLAISSDSKTAITGGEDWRIRFWDVERAEPLAWFRPGEGTVSFVSFSPDGSQIATLVGRRLAIWKTKDLLPSRN